MHLNEAATVKARAKGLLKAIRELLGDKSLPKTVHDALDTASGALTKTWADLEADAADNPASDPAGGEAATESARHRTLRRALLEAEMSFDDRRQLLRSAIAAKLGGNSMMMWIRDMYDDYCVYEQDGDSGGPMGLYKISYSILDGQVTLGDPVKVVAVTTYQAVGESRRLGEAKVTKSEGDAGDFPASDYAYVPDPEKPSTWKLRLTAQPGGEPDAHIVGLACAALGKGMMGNPVEIPQADMPAVKAKVRAAWKKANPGKKDSEMPEGIQESETTEISGDLVPLIEKAVRRDGTIPLKIIQPGWGSSGYYSPDMLKRDGPQVFRSGLHMYYDHPTPTEEAERPERSLKDLAAVLVTDASWQDNGLAGPGLYADAKVFSDYKEQIEERAPHMGVSIRALGKPKPGEAEGRKGAIIEKIVAAQSIDMVTVPGAGGQIVLSESAHNAVTRLQGTEGGISMTISDEEARRLTESNAQLSAQVRQLQERELFRDSRDYVAEVLRPLDLPDITRTRLIETLALRPATKDGMLDKAIFKTQIEAAAKTELAYLAEVSGSGRIRGMGGTSTAPQFTDEDLEKSLRESFLGMGMDEKRAAIAAKGR